MQKDILDFLSEFAVFLQDHKFAVSESALAHLLRLVESAGVDITEEDEMLAALSVCLAKTGEQVAKMKALFREFLSKKTIPQREKQKEKEKQEKRKELDLFVSDAQKQLENLKKQKERIRKNIIQKAHENEPKPKVSRKAQTQLKISNGATNLSLAQLDDLSRYKAAQTKVKRTIKVASENADDNATEEEGSKVVLTPPDGEARYYYLDQMALDPYALFQD